MAEPVHRHPNSLVDTFMRFLPWLWAVVLLSCAVPRLNALASETTTAAESSAVRRERVLIIVRENCPTCDATLRKLRGTGGTFEALQAKGWQIGTTPDVHIQVVNYQEVPDLAKSVGAADFPVMLGMEG